MRILWLCSLMTIAGCATTAPTHPQATRGLRSIPLPGAGGAVSMDYLAYDPQRHRVWAPAGDTGSVDVVEVGSGQVTRVEGFGVAQLERNGRKRVVGPSSVTIGKHLAWVGDRGDSTVCEVDLTSLQKGVCLTLESRPDAVVFVAAKDEVWVTAPADKRLYILDVASAGRILMKQRIELDGEPEGFAVDATHGVFFTNYEDKDLTLAIDIESRRILQTWKPGCGAEGPKGLAIDLVHDYLMVACSDQLVVLDAGHDGTELSRVRTGAGNDNIDYLPSRRELFAGAGKAGTLSIAGLDDAGKLSIVSVVPTATGARNAVATETGAAYLACGPEGRLLVVPPVP